MNHLSVSIDSAAVAVRESIASKKELFSFCGRLAADCYGLEKSSVIVGLDEREQLGSTGFGGAVAIPHAKIEGLDQCVGLFIRLTNPMAFDSHDDQPVDMIFGLLSPAKAGAEHLKALAEISRFLRDENMVAKLRGAKGEDALFVLLTGQREQQAA